MPLSEVQQRQIHHSVRQVEAAGRQVILELEAALPFNEATRDAVRVGFAKMEIWAGHVEAMLLRQADGGGPRPGSPSEAELAAEEDIDKLDRQFNQLALMQAELEGRRRKAARQAEHIALDRRALATRHVAEELDHGLGRVGG
ncbi:MAG TPA: hypothetical protein VGC13_22355 [Longimicrobium sp.]|jgi:hypothetical protein|uniref:hypothetical protein n=1 Tax=Longimicrobium sp. TaxID=2029185 RepID=UPI002EDA9724